MGTTLLVILLVVGFLVFTGYNKLVSAKEAVHTDKNNIGVYLDERNKVFDSLIASVKKYMDYEKGTFAEIVKLREKSQGKDVSEDKDAHDAEEQLSKMIASGELSKGISVTMEAYPDLKSSTNMLQMQESIVSIERKLANAKKAYNMSIEDYNAYAEGIPGIWIVKMFPNLKHEFIRWTLTDEAIKTSEERVVSFD